MKKYKAVVIGCGKIGVEEANYRKAVQPITHAASYYNNQRTELVALVDIDKKRLKIARKYFPQVPLFDSGKEMFEKIKPDIVSIATNSNSHAYLVKMAAKYKTDAILCEKPITESVKDAEEMIKICKQNKSLLFINHQRRFDPLLQKWQAKIKKGSIGKIIQVNCYYYNGLFNNGTHVVDLLRFFLGDIDWVRGVINKQTSWKRNDKNIDALIGFENGALVSMQTLAKNYGFLDFSFYGTKGYFAVKNLGYEVEYRKLIKNKYFKNYYQLSDKTEIYGKMRSFMRPVVEHIVSCLDGKAKPVSRGEDGLSVLKILFALKQSAEQNSKVIKIK